MEAAGRIEERDLSKYDFLHPIMPTERLTRNEVLQLHYNLLRKFYMQPRILWEGLTDRNPYKRKFFKFVLRHVAREITRRPWRQPNYVTFEDFRASRENRPA
jgi:hypothetical protein